MSLTLSPPPPRPLRHLVSGRTTVGIAAFAFGTLLLGCGGGGSTESGADPSPNDPSLPADDGPPTTSGSASPATSGGASSATPTTNPAMTANPMATAPAPTAPQPMDPPAPGGIVNAGTPEILIDNLDFPGRVALDGDAILVANRSHHRDPALPDELLRVPKDGSAPTTIVEAPSMEGFLAVGTQIWINSFETTSVMGFDRVTGASTFNIPLDPGTTPVQMVQNDTHVFVTLASATRLLRVDKDGSNAEIIWSDDSSSAVQWLKATNESVFMISNDVATGTSEARVIRIAADGSSSELLVTQGASEFGGLELSGSDVLFTDYSLGTIESVPAAGGTSKTLGSVLQPWALTADTENIYVSAQPELCEDGLTGDVYKLPLQGGAPETLASALLCPSMLIADVDALYWVNNGETSLDEELPMTTTASNGSLMRLPRQ